MTTVIQDRDLCRVRLRFLDLFKSFFDQQPDAEKLARWRGIFAALAKAQISPAFDREANAISELLWKINLNELENEYNQVFANPSVKKPVARNVPLRRKGANLLEVPAAAREFMAEVGLASAQAATVPEDSPVVLLDILAALVEEEKAEDKRWARTLQARLLTHSLKPLAVQWTGVLRDNEAAFYLSCGRLLCSYLELEVEMVDAGNTPLKLFSDFGTTIAGSRINPRLGRARKAFAGLFAATAALSGAAMTAKTLVKTAAAPSHSQPSRSARRRTIFYPVQKANRLPDSFGERDALPKSGLG